jgi:ABC-type transport system substrate-binding protein
VRQALYQAIDIEALKTRTMRGAAVPTNLMVAPGITGFVPELNVRLPYDLAAAKKLLAAAGYPKGFEVGMNCPNDRYVNDAEICQAIAVMLSKIDVKVNLESETKVTYFPKGPGAEDVVLFAGLDTVNLRFAQSIAAVDDDAGGAGCPGIIQYRRLQQLARRPIDAADRHRGGHEKAQSAHRRGVQGSRR